MRQMVYYVATSVDGYIAGDNHALTGFVFEGDSVAAYLADLQDFDTVLMGRTTYEMGYQFGVEPGQPSPVYGDMKHYIFSDNLILPHLHPNVQIRPLDKAFIEQLKAMQGQPIYVCGGGKLAGWLLKNGLLDTIKVKINPVILGNGTKLFEDLEVPHRLLFQDLESFEIGVQVLTYEVCYEALG